MFSHTSNIDRFGEYPLCLMSAGIAATSPAFITTFARGFPVLPSSTSQMISSQAWMNHSTRSLPWKIGRMCSSVVGHIRLSFTTEHTDGFQVTSDRDK